jgi:hypothetical protein
MISSPAIAFCLDGEFLYVAGGSNGAEKHKVGGCHTVTQSRSHALTHQSIITVQFIPMYIHHTRPSYTC